MAISRKPKQSSSATTKHVDVNALINKGGSIGGKNGGQEKDTVPVILRVPEDILERVDASVQARRIKTPRHTWLLEAVLEKLEKESA